MRFSLAPWILSPESLVDLQAIFYHRLLQMLSRVPQGSKVRFSLAPWILSLESLVDLQAIFYHRLLQMLSPFGLSL